MGANSQNCAPVLSSLWCELVFNDARDAERRGNKKEEVSHTQCHAVAAKSICQRAGKIPHQRPLELSDADWAMELPGKALKANVFQSGRMTDKSLGIETSGLTRSRTNASLTKPHVFQQRLCLMKHLVEKFHASKASGDEFDATAEVQKMWVNQLFLTDFFVSWEGRDQTEQLLVIGKCPYAVWCYKLEQVGDLWAPSHQSLGASKIQEISFDNFDSIQVAAAQTCFYEGDAPSLAWKQNSGWMPMKIFVCEHLILTIPATLLSSVCKHLKVRGYTRVCHKERCRLLMEHCGYDAAHIKETMLLLPETEKRAKSCEDCLSLRPFFVHMNRVWNRVVPTSFERHCIHPVSMYHYFNVPFRISRVFTNEGDG